MANQSNLKDPNRFKRYGIAALAGILAGPIGIVLSPFVLYMCFKIKHNHKHTINPWINWAVQGVIFAPFLPIIFVLTGAPSWLAPGWLARNGPGSLVIAMFTNSTSSLETAESRKKRVLEFHAMVEENEQNAMKKEGELEMWELKTRGLQEECNTVDCLLLTTSRQVNKCVSMGFSSNDCNYAYRECGNHFNRFNYIERRPGSLDPGWDNIDERLTNDLLNFTAEACKLGYYPS